MSNRIFKNYQVNVGLPFQVRPGLSFQTIKTVNPFDDSPGDKDEERDIEAHLKRNADEVIENAREEAKMIIREAEFEAQKILDSARLELDEMRLAVEDEARQQGYAQGLGEAQNEYEGLLREAELIKEQAKVEYEEVLGGMESDAVNMILDIARKVIGDEISLNKENILFLVKQAFEKCSNRDNILLKVAPGDYDYIVQNKEKLLSMNEGIGELEIKKDFSLKEGSCMVETLYGSVDAGIHTKLKKIEEAFKEALEK